MYKVLGIKCTSHRSKSRRANNIRSLYYHCQGRPACSASEVSRLALFVDVIGDVRPRPTAISCAMQPASLVACYNDTLTSLLTSTHHLLVSNHGHLSTTAPVSWLRRTPDVLNAFTAVTKAPPIVTTGTASSTLLVDCARLSWLFCQRLSARKYIASYRIVTHCDVCGANVITSSTGLKHVNDPKALSSKVTMQLKTRYDTTPRSNAPSSHNATDFANFFRSKVDKMREETINASPPPIIADRACDSLSALDDVTAEEILRLCTTPQRNTVLSTQ